MREPVRGVVAQAAEMRVQKTQETRDEQKLRALLNADDNQYDAEKAWQLYRDLNYPSITDPTARAKPRVVALRLRAVREKRR